MKHQHSSCACFFSLLFIHTWWSPKSCPQVLLKGLGWVVAMGTPPSTPQPRHLPISLCLYLSLPRSPSLSSMVMSGLHWELNEVDCPLVSAISGN